MQPGLDQEVDHCCQTAFAEVRPCPCGSGNLTSSPIHIQSPMSRTHKSNFSASTLHGAQSAVILGSHHPEPKSLRSSGGSRSHSRSSSSAAVAPWAALDVAKLSEEVRNLRISAIPLKRPTFRNLTKTRNLSFEGQRTPSLMSQPRCRDTCVLKSVRFKNADPCDTPTTDSSPYGLHNLNGSLPEMPCSGFFLLSAIDTIVSGCSRSAIEYPSEFAIISS